MDRFRSKLVSCILSVANTLALTNALAFCEIRTLQASNVFIINLIKLFCVNLLTLVGKLYLFTIQKNHVYIYKMV